MTFDRYLTEPEEKQLLKAVRERAGDQTQQARIVARDYAWMRLMRYTGIRVGALCGLTLGDAREAERTGYLTLRPAIQKRGQAGKVFLTKEATKALVDLRASRLSVNPCAGLLDDDHLLVGRPAGRAGDSVTPRNLQLRLAHWCTLAGLQAHVTPHWFRHTLAKRLMKNSTAGDPRGVVKSVLGHRSIQSTSVYTEPDKEDIEDALREVNRK